MGHNRSATTGTISTGDIVDLKVNSGRRKDICKNHTATHMLQAALRSVLGDHVHQSGSYVDDERLRFDFNHFSALSEEELKKVEQIVNENIMEVYDVHTDVMSLEEAKNSGAMALFNEKYGNDVRVVKIGSFSKELCGGTHVKNSGEIGLFKIISETGVAAGVRRIEAVTGFKAISLVEGKAKLIKEIEGLFKCAEKEVLNKIQLQQFELKEKEKEISLLKSKIASGSEEEILTNVKEVKGVKFVTGALKDIDSDSLRDLCDKLRNKLGSGVVVLGSSVEGKVQLVAMSTKDAVSSGVHCGKIIKEVAAITGGGGGGRPDMAQAGGKNPEKLQEALDIVETILGNLVK